MDRSLLIKITIFALAAAIFAYLHIQIGEIEGDGDRTGSYMVLYMIGGAVLAVLAAAFFIPVIGDKIGQFFYSAPEPVVPDEGSKARALEAQGEFEDALQAYLVLAENHPEDRLPVVEAIRIARERLEDSPRAVGIIKDALDREWEVDDAAFFLFRLAEIHELDFGDEDNAASILRQVIGIFPDTRHSANAIHKLREWNLEIGPTPGNPGV